MQSSSSSRPFKPGLIGASPITDANCSQGVISSARRSAKAEVRGANPRESANSKPLCLQQLQGEFRKLVLWPRANARCKTDQGLQPLPAGYGLAGQLNGDHDVTAASRPVKAFVPVRIRLVTPISPDFDGSQDWVIVDNDEVAGSSPASGSKCRG